MAQVVDIKNSDGSVSVKNPAFNVEIDKTVVQANGNEQDDSVHDKFAMQNNEKENEQLLTQ